MLHLDILDEARRVLFAQLGFLADKEFYMAGGTALALQIGHRDSIDFDFFCPEGFDVATVTEWVTSNLPSHNVVLTYTETDTAYYLVDGSIKISLIKYSYKLVEPLVRVDDVDLASIVDIACMKMAAITSRQAQKDYVDIYFILQKLSLADVLISLRVKLPTIDPEIVLKSLVYFDDIGPEQIIYRTKPVNFEDIKKYLQTCVRGYYRGII
jgi:hypothetical protein